MTSGIPLNFDHDPLAGLLRFQCRCKHLVNMDMQSGLMKACIYNEILITF